MRGEVVPIDVNKGGRTPFYTRIKRIPNQLRYGFGLLWVVSNLISF